jgi:hypothetical protein
MHILIDPSFFVTNNIGAPHGNILWRIKPLSKSSWSYSFSYFNSEDAIQSALEIGLVPGTHSIPNSTSLCGGNLD